MPSMYILPISTYDVPSGESDPLIADFSVMKLEKEREPRLRITDRTGTARYDENFIGKLLGMNPDINFEYNHDFTIEISFGSFTINFLITVFIQILFPLIQNSFYSIRCTPLFLLHH